MTATPPPDGPSTTVPPAGSLPTPPQLPDSFAASPPAGSFTTPPRPVDIATVFPELRGLATTATRLHPRPGAPGVTDSSVGGPLLWPADEPWPFCHDGDKHYVHRLQTPATVRRSRAIHAAARGRDLTAEERDALPGWDFSEPHDLVDQPIPLVPVAQLYRRDIPDFAGPDDCDLLQVLWCPLDHPDEHHNPRVRVYWRRSADVTGPPVVPPEPPVVRDEYLPTPCAVHPDRVVEYPPQELLPDSLAERITAWDDDQAEPLYQYDLSLSPGWKAGGFACGSVSDIWEWHCTECGAPMRLLLAAASAEWGDGRSWRPPQDPADADCYVTGVCIGRGWDLNILHCSTSFDHPILAVGA
ncbi:hypothetical protein [Actinoplanes philippinensis]|uniref:hypothetical protein n=1 Tax=Actinoplanes philippinensis TaxID=35752 RepID=UPI0034052923